MFEHKGLSIGKRPNLRLYGNGDDEYRSGRFLAGARCQPFHVVIRGLSTNDALVRPESWLRYALGTDRNGALGQSFAGASAFRASAIY